MMRLRKWDKKPATGVSGRREEHGIGRFRRGEDGSLIIFGLFLFVLMLMIGGMAVDLMRYETQRARLQSTLDRAILAAASLDQPLTPEQVVQDYFSKANLSASLGTVTSTTTLTSRQVTAEANMQVNSMFLNFMGITHLEAPAAGTAEESATRTEISLIVDVSGSMGWPSSATGNSKIWELQDAAVEFVNIMQCNPENPNDIVNCTVEPEMISINLVPYSEQVTAGATILNELNVTNEHTNSTCVTFDAAHFNTAALSPTAQLKRTGHFDPSSGASSTPYNFPCRPNAWREIIPLEDDPADMRTAINALQDGGWTSTDLGLKWGAAFLDPSFAPVVNNLATAGHIITAFDDRPYSYTETGAVKAVVLMTDGVNTKQHYLYDSYRSGPSPVYYNSTHNNRMSIYRASNNNYYWTHTGEWKNHPYGADPSEPGNAIQMSYPELWAVKTWNWYTQWWWLNSPGTYHYTGTKDTRLDNLCDAVKAQGVVIFTVGFEVTDASAAVMQSCASSPAHFFDVDGSDLTDAFASIARQITALRLVN